MYRKITFALTFNLAVVAPLVAQERDTVFKGSVRRVWRTRTETNSA